MYKKDGEATLEGGNAEGGIAEGRIVKAQTMCIERSRINPPGFSDSHLRRSTMFAVVSFNIASVQSDGG